MIKKELFIGFVTGLLFVLLGTALCILLFSLYKSAEFTTTFNTIVKQDKLWALLSIGAIPSLLVFFKFLNNNKIYRARGVMISTFLTAFMVYYLYFF